jgi:uncharacterized protein (DUF1778 family)
MTQLKINLTAQDKATIKAAADEMRLSMAAFVRLAALRAAAKE